MSAIKGSEDLNKELQAEQLETLSKETEAITPEDGSDADSDAGKLRQLLGVLKKVIGVKDLANLRLSLPANLMEPQGNLEYWHYLDRPDLFAAIGDKSLDPLTRFIAILRWALTKELRFVRGRVCKPYSEFSVRLATNIFSPPAETTSYNCLTSACIHDVLLLSLGEQFRCAWEVLPAASQSFAVYHDVYTGPGDPDIAPSTSASPALSASSTNLPKSMSTLSLNDTASLQKKKLSSTTNGTASAASSVANVEAVSKAVPSEPCRVAFVNEQVCHHPPISAFWYESTPNEERAKVCATGIDQIAAKFNGTSVKIGPGSQNKGIFVSIPDAVEEEYQITHPGGYITGFISRAPYVTLAENMYVNTLRKAKTSKGKTYRAIITYPEESWISKPRFLLEGVIYETDGTEKTEYTSIKKVPESVIVAKIKGNWRGKITVKKTNEKTENVLVDLKMLDIVQKSVRPLDRQDSMESRKFWEPVTTAINKKDYRQATAHKQAIEQAQRDKAAERVKKNDEFVPVFFDPDISDGKGKLTTKGKEVLKEELDMVDHKR